MPLSVAQAMMEMGRPRDKACGIDVHEGPLVAKIVERGKDEPIVGEFVNDCQGHQELVRWLKKHKCNHVGMESTSVYWKALCAVLRRHGIKEHVANAQTINQVPGNKNDDRDALWIAKLTLDGYLPDSNVLDDEAEDYRFLVRSRQSIVRERTTIKNRISALIARTGLRFKASDKFGKACRTLLTEIADGKNLEEVFTPKRCKKFGLNLDGFMGALNGHLTSEKKIILKQMLDNLSELDRSIGILEDCLLEKNEEPVRKQLILILKSMPGIHDIAASMILAEIGDISSFDSPKKLSRYAGLAPSNFQSGERIREGIRMKKEVQGSPSKHCNMRLKYIMGICARVVIDAKESELNKPLKDFYKRRLKKSKSTRAMRSAKIALAHKMIKIIWHLLTKKECYIGSSNSTKAPVPRRVPHPCAAPDPEFKELFMRTIKVLSEPKVRIPEKKGGCKKG